MTCLEREKYGNVTFLQVEPTTYCNFSCGFCAGRYLDQGYIDFTLFMQILDFFSGVQYLELQGEGEPLMHPLFFDLLEEAAARSVKVSMITNGSLLTQAACEKIIRHGMECLFISIDTADPGEFRTLRGGDLSQILGNISSFIKQRMNLKSRIPAVGIAMILTETTIAGMDEILHIYRNLGLDGGFIFQPLQCMDAYSRHYSKTVHDMIPGEEQAAEFNRALNQYASLIKIQRDVDRIKSFYEMLFNDFDPGLLGCPWLSRGAYTDHRGFLLPCCKVKDAGSFALGIIGRSSLSEFLEKRKKLNGLLLSGNVPGCCEGCGVAGRAAAAAEKRIKYR